MAERRAPPPKLFAMVAEFDRPQALLEATKKTRAKGFSRIEAFSPFPVDGLAEAVGFRERAIAPIILAGGILGAAGGYFMQVWVNLDFPLNIGGRPVVPPPAFVLITFELMVLCAVTAGVVAMLLLNRLPRLHYPLFDIESFHFASNDKFFLAIMADDAKFEPAATRRFLNSLDPVRVDGAPLRSPAS